jgi:hypothetical protein
MVKRALAALSACVFLSFGAPGAQAAPPPNDDFANALPLAAGAGISADNLDATGQVGEPNPANGATSENCPDPGAKPDCATSVWYTFEPPGSGEYTIETCDMGTDVDTVLGIFTGSSFGALTPLVANDDGIGTCEGGYGGNGSRLSFPAAAGAVYFVDLTGYHADQGSFYLRAYAGAPQARPQPDTRIVREGVSFAQALASPSQPGVRSGSRHSASFVLDSDAGGAAYECSLDGAAFAACTSPVSYRGLAPGSFHSFAARSALGGNVDPTPAVERFTLDATPPQTTIVAGPHGDTAETSATWTFESSERNPNDHEFLCRVDGGPRVSCGNSRAYAALCGGSHSFEAAATDGAGNVDPTPALAQVEVTAGTACAEPTLGEPSASVASTRANLEVEFDNHGSGATLLLEYGTSTAYGETAQETALDPGASGTKSFELGPLLPGTLYHYRLTISSGGGSASSGDRTLTTTPLAGTLPAVVLGTPSATQYAAQVPMTIDPAGIDTVYKLQIAAGAPTASASESATLSKEATIPGGATGPQPATIELVDLDPATTYRFRVAATHVTGDGNGVWSPEATFTTPALGGAPSAGPTATAASARAVRGPFKLRSSSVSVGELRRGSRRLFIRVRDVPQGSVVRLQLTAGKAKLKARKVAAAAGLVKFDLKLPEILRKALQSRQVKVVTVLVAVSSPGEAPSSVTLKSKLRGA